MSSTIRPDDNGRDHSRVLKGLHIRPGVAVAVAAAKGGNDFEGTRGPLTLPFQVSESLALVSAG
jgi:hypothetical protein